VSEVGSEQGSAWGRALVVIGLLGLVVTQPTLDLFGRNPTFFTAGPYGRAQIVAFGLAVVVVPAVIAVVVVLGTDRLHPRLGRLCYLGCVAVLGSLFGNILLRGLGVDDGRLAAVATILGAAAAVAIEATTPGRMLLRFLAVANVAFLAFFLVLSPTAGLVRSSGSVDLGSVTVPDPPGPIVVVVLDELPVTTLMRADGSINADRFPGFARLAERSTWFRNASVHHTSTHLAVPALLTGTMTDEDALPSYQDHPRNLTTLLGERVPVSAYEPVTNLCPPSTCEPPDRPPLSQALRDASVVYAHRLLPAGLRDGLPDIEASWGGFIDGTDGAELPEGMDPEDPFTKLYQVDPDERSRPGQAAVLASRTGAIGPEPALHLIHVLLPHSPWVLTPEGGQLLNTPARIRDPEEPGYEWASRERFQLHSLQAGAADVAIGRLVDHLDDLGVWETTTLVVVADHGVATSGLERLNPPDYGRELTPQSADELLRVPLFIHSPALEDGAVVDEPAQSIDLLPTLVDLLDIETDWAFDGHSLVDGSAPEVMPLVGDDVADVVAVAQRHAAEFPHGDDWTALAAVGDHGDLVGRPLADLTVGEPSSLRLDLDYGRRIRHLPVEGALVPRLLTGTVSGSVVEPPELVVVVNGTVAGVTGGYVPTGQRWRFESILGPFLVDGANEYEAYEVDKTAGGRVVLHPLST
jgi:hypothetical protein